MRAELRVAVVAVVALSAIAVSAAPPAASRRDADPEEAVHAMLRPMASAPEATARVSIERSDPFGGPPEVERGRLWYLPGRGLRYKSEGKGGHEMVVFELMRRLASVGRAVLMVSHQLNLVARFEFFVDFDDSRHQRVRNRKHDFSNKTAERDS